MNGFPVVADPVNVARGPFGWPTRTVTGLYRSNGYPDPFHDTPAVKLLREAVFYIDAANSVAGERRAINQGSGGPALDARYGGNIGAVTTNYPLLLTKAADEPAYLSLPGIANNTIGCTAPANTASYAAYPVGGGAATTGAAGAGAFTLQTAGSWVRVDLLDAGAVVLASFVAANSGQSGYTDAFSVVWTIARHTSGRKTVLVTRPCWLLGTDDYLEVPNHPLLNITKEFTVMFVGRHWDTAASYALLGTRTDAAIGTATGTPGWSLSTTAQSASVNRTHVIVEDGTNIASTGGSGVIGWTAGSLQAFYGIGSANTVRTRSSAGGASTAVSALTVGPMGNRNPMQIGRSFTTSRYLSAEMIATAVFRRALTTTEIATINTHFGT